MCVVSIYRTLSLASSYLQSKFHCHKYAIRSTNITWHKVCLEDQSYPNMRTKKATKYVGIKRRFCKLNQRPHIENTRNPPKCLWQIIRSVNPVWTSLPSGLPWSQQKSENYTSVQCRLSGKICAFFFCVGTICRMWLFSGTFYTDSSLVQGLIYAEFSIFICFVLSVVNNLCSACLVYPV
jgi:hypothetical protein